MLSLKHVSALSDRVACLLTVLALEIFQFPLPACSSICVGISWLLSPSNHGPSAITVLQLNWLMQWLHYLHLPPTTKPTDTFPLVFVACGYHLGIILLEIVIMILVLLFIRGEITMCGQQVNNYRSIPFPQMGMLVYCA